jgi:hypothetical protein
MKFYVKGMRRTLPNLIEGHENNIIKSHRRSEEMRIIFLKSSANMTCMDLLNQGNDETSPFEKLVDGFEVKFDMDLIRKKG